MLPSPDETLLAILTSSSPRSSPELRRPGQRRSGRRSDTLPARGHRPPAHLRRPPGSPATTTPPERSRSSQPSPTSSSPASGALHRCARQPCLPRFLRSALPSVRGHDSHDDSTGTNSTSSSTPGATGVGSRTRGSARGGLPHHLLAGVATCVTLVAKGSANIVAKRSRVRILEESI